ncbi:LOW QUALITY PROTEIN: kinesin-like protein KIN-7I [Octopus sinensis]|uniref:LOW QUALITY PROTEIN: kinesin-like protein KIN-7I n=1 Tax=Octopus sinensis TaxID=2607531 RepID=A0A7E6FGX3_9MOLL|nr:LOW QUALITY PROTEIN: kinesin-like protein KIN-7I [Octopus sinensis]
MSDKIQVVIRLRPLNEREKHNGSDLAWQTREKRIISATEGTNNQSYMFDRVYDCNDITADIYHETVEPIICATMEGFNGTIFAYGQTSSGKTYTMSGSKEEKGIIPMAMQSMFDAIDNAPNRQFLLRVSYMEIYNEKITDLLDVEEKTLKLLEDENRVVHVSGLKEMVFQNIDDMLAIKKKGDSRRRVAETARNEESSRSHAIFCMIIESQERQDNDDDDLRDESVRLSLLYFIDLAGSEKCSENTGDRFREGCAINKSLSVLGQVISKLSDGISHQHINYRDSKLTRLLQNGLGGNSKTAIICTINPTAIDETHSTLRFASRAKTINNQPMINEITDVSNKAILKRYQQEIHQLKKQLESYKKQTPQKNLNPYYRFISNDSEKEQLEKKYQNTIDTLKKMICVSTSENTKQRIIRRKTWCPGLLKRKIEAPITDACRTPARFLDSIAETSLSDDESKTTDTSNNLKRISNGKPLVNYVSCSVQTECKNENEHFLRFENEMLKNMLTMKENESHMPSPTKKPRLSVPDHDETKEFLELELQCVNDGIKLSVEEEKIEKERQRLKEEKTNHDREVKAFIDSKTDLMQKVQSTEIENMYLLSKLQNSQERVKSLEEELQHAQRSSLLDTSCCSNSGDRPLLNLSNITSRSASRSARIADYNLLNDQIFNLESQVQILESQVQKLSHDLQLAKEQILSKSEEITFLSSENNEQKLELNKLIAENDKLNQLVQDKTPVFEHKEYIDLKTQLNKVMQDNEKLNYKLKLKAEELTYLSRASVDQQVQLDDKIPELSTSEESKTPEDNNDVLSELQEQLAATIREKEKIALELAIKGEECTKLQENVEIAHLVVLEMKKSLKETREHLLAQKDVDLSQIEQLDTSIRKSMSLNSADRSQWKSVSIVHQVNLKDNDKDDSDVLITSLEDYDSSDISDLASKSQLLECQTSLDKKIQECHSLKDEINSLKKEVEIKTKECSSLKIKLESFESVSEVRSNPIIVSQQNSNESDSELERLKHGSGELVEDENLQIQNNLHQLNSLARDCTLDKQEYDYLKGELLSNKAELEAKRQQCEDLVEQLSEMKSKFSDYKTQKDKEIEALQCSLQRLESKALEYDVLVEEIGRSEGESKEKADIILLKSELSHKTKELNDLKEKHKLLFESSESKIQNFAALEKEIRDFNILDAEQEEQLFSADVNLQSAKQEICDGLELNLSHSGYIDNIQPNSFDINEDDIIELRKELKSKLTYINELKRDNSNLKDSLERLTAENAGFISLDSKLNVCQKELQSKVDECHNLAAELDLRAQDSEMIKELEENLSAKSQECLFLSKELSLLKERKMDDNERVTELPEIKESEMDELKEIEEKLSAKSQECLVHSREFSELEGRNIELNKTVKELEEELSEKSQECLALSKVLSELKQKNMEESITVKELEEKLSEKSEECSALFKELSELKDGKMEESVTVKELEEKLSEKSEECLAHSRELSELQAGEMKTEKHFACELEQKRKEQIELTNELAAFKQDKENQINDLEKQLMVKTQEYNSLSENLKSLEITHSGIQSDLKKELEEKCQLYECQSNELDTILQKYSSLQGSLLELKSDIAKKYNEIKDKDLEIEELRHQALCLQSQLTKKDQLHVTPGSNNESMNKESSEIKEEISNNSTIQKPNNSGVYNDSTDVQNLLKEKVQECSFLTDKLENLEKNIQEKTEMLKKLKREKILQSEKLEKYEWKAEKAEFFRKKFEDQMNKTSCLEDELEKQKEMCTLPSDSHLSSKSNIHECSNCAAMANQIREAEQKQCHVITCLQTEIKNFTSEIEELSKENGLFKETIHKLQTETMSEKQNCTTNMESKGKGVNTDDVEDLRKQLSDKFMSLARAEATNKISKLHFSKLESSYKETISILEDKIKYLQEELRRAQVNSDENTISIKREVPAKPSSPHKSNVIPSRGVVDQLAIVTLEAEKAKLHRKLETLQQKLLNSLKNNEDLKKELSVHKNVAITKKLAVVNKSTGTERCEAAESPVNIKPPLTPSRSMKDDCKSQ